MGVAGAGPFVRLLQDRQRKAGKPHIQTKHETRLQAFQNIIKESDPTSESYSKYFNLCFSLDAMS